MYNKHVIVGRVGGEISLRYTTSGTEVASFSVATSKKFKDKDGQNQEDSTWHDIVVWGKLATICGEYLAKGSLVLLEGEIKKRKWQDKDGNNRISVETVAREMTMLSPKSEKSNYKPEPQANQDVPF